MAGFEDCFHNVTLPLEINNPWKSSNGLHLIGDKPLGQGAFGSVWKARHAGDEEYYAIKQINVERAAKLFQSPGKLEREVENHSKIRSSFIVQYYNYWYERVDASSGKLMTDKNLDKVFMQDKSEAAGYSKWTANESSYTSDDGTDAKETMHDTHLFIQMEFCNYKTLRNFLNEQINLDERLVHIPSMVHQLAQGLSAIHSVGVIHRDLKPENIICTISSQSGRFLWKIADFGLSVIPEWDFAKNMENLWIYDADDDQDTNNPSVAGTLCYRSPEMMAGNNAPKVYSEKTDIFSLGVIFLEAVSPLLLNSRTRRGLCCDLQGISSKLGTEDLLKPYLVGKRISKYLASVIIRMLDRDPLKRPTASNIVSETIFPLSYCVQKPREDFIGRGTQLKQIYAEFTQTEEKSFYIFGKHSGIGTTQLVRTFLQNYSSPHTQIWINLKLSAFSSVSSAINDLAVELDIPIRIIGPVSFPRNTNHLFNDICRALVDQRHLDTVIILDGISESENWILDKLLSHNIPFIGITQDDDCRKNGKCPVLLELDVFTPEESLHYLNAALQNCNVEESIMQNLAILLHRHPLALNLSVKALMYRYERSVRNKTDHEDATPSSLTSLINSFIHKAKISLPEWEHDGNEDVVLSWSPLDKAVAISVAIIMEMISQDETNLVEVAAIIILKILYYVDNTGTTFQMVAGLGQALGIDSVEQVRKGLDLLESLGLVEIFVAEKDSPFVKIANEITLQLIELILIEGEEGEELDLEGTRKCLAYLRDSSKGINAVILDAMFFWLRCPKSKQLVIDFAEFIVACSQRLNNPELHTMWEPFNEYCLIVFEQCLGVDNINTLRLELENAKSFKALGKFEEALPSYEKLLVKCESLMARDDDFVTVVANGVGLVLMNLGELEKSAAILEQNLGYLIQKHGLDHNGVASVKHNLGLIQLRQENYEDARKTLEEVLDWYALHLGRDHPDTAATKRSLALILMADGNVRTAKDLLDEVLASGIKLMGENSSDDQDMLQTKALLAACLVGVGEPNDARKLLRNVLPAQTQVLGKDHPFVESTKNVVKLLQNMERHAERLSTMNND